MKKNFLIYLLMTLLCPACKQAIVNQPPQAGSFAYDQAFILKHDPAAIVLGKGDDRIIVSPKYQGKVFTSTFAGDSGKSLGWLNYKAFEGTPDKHMNAYGGEDRLWLGPVSY